MTGTQEVYVQEATKFVCEWRRRFCSTNSMSVYADRDHCIQVAMECARRFLSDLGLDSHPPPPADKVDVFLVAMRFTLFWEQVFLILSSEPLLGFVICFHRKWVCKAFQFHADMMPFLSPAAPAAPAAPTVSPRFLTPLSSPDCPSKKKKKMDKTGSDPTQPC
jgi:hypothetical protein